MYFSPVVFERSWELSGKTVCQTKQSAYVSLGALKMQDMKMQDMKLTDQYARHEIAGHENVGHENAGHAKAMQKTSSEAVNV